MWGRAGRNIHCGVDRVIFVTTLLGQADGMDIEFDPVKRERTLRERGLDYADAWRLFDGETFTAPDLRFDYGEGRMVSYGRIDGLAIVVVWTERNGKRRIISMRRAHEWEMERVRLGRS